MEPTHPSQFSQKIVVYSTTFCPYCIRAYHLLNQRGYDYAKVDVSGDDAARAWLVDVTQRLTVPQIFIHGLPIGGYTELASLDRSGGLAELLRR